ncbi:MAG: erythromycin esterase, partial [Candidatus Eremiobacteraeota bacterium]|nr:erythromycin esterase [Candidatus Eremiobacteraeota bacterium]
MFIAILVLSSSPTRLGSTDATPPATKPDSAIVRQLREIAAPLKTLDPGAPLDDLGDFERAVGRSRVIGLGEATHGTSEFFVLKHRLFRDLVEKKGFSVLAFEANVAEARDIEAYVTTGKWGSRLALKLVQTPPWQTEEVLHLVEWMRA